MPTIDRESARNLLEKAFVEAERYLLTSTLPSLESRLSHAVERVFASNTQAYREVLLGCTVVRLLAPAVNIRLPYVAQGPAAYSGRSLDEQVINPFLQSKRIPCSRGPYLNVFRRNVQFDESIRAGLRDTEGYDAFLTVLAYLEHESAPHAFLVYLLYLFARMRESSSISLSRIQRISLAQYDQLIGGLLEVQSGGRFPVLFTVAMFETIKAFYGLAWQIAYQGINVADAASGATGDITVRDGEHVVLAVEVTQRTVDQSRVISTFNTKIAPQGIDDYLFCLGDTAPTVDARRQAEQYFAQGHEVNFISIKEWILMSLATMGKRGRSIFNTQLMLLMESEDVPAPLKVSWNDHVSALMSI